MLPLHVRVIDSITSVFNPKISFKTCVASYLEWAQTEYEHPASFARINTSFRSIVAAFGDSAITDVTPAAIEMYKTARRARGIRAVTVRNDLNAMSAFFRFAQQQGWVSENPVHQVRKPSVAGAIRIRIVSTEEERRYLSTAASSKSPLYDVARLMLSTGMRPSEVLALEACDFDSARSTVTVRRGKTLAARRTLMLADREIHELVCRRAYTGCRFLFPGIDKSRPATKLNMPHFRILRDSGVSRFCLYDLRHTFATRMAERGMPLTTLAAILGHNGLRCVLRYVHPNQQAMDEAMLRFGRTSGV